MSTYLKSILIHQIALPVLGVVAKLGDIIEVADDDIADKLLSRVSYNDEDGSELPHWEKSTAKAYKDQQEAKGKQVAEAPARKAATDDGNDNDTHEDQNEPANTPPPAPQVVSDTRLSSEGEAGNANDEPANTEPPKAAEKAPAAKAPAKAPAKPAAKPAAKAPVKPAAKPAKRAAPAQRPAKK